ncbi:MAG: hypothetical protein GY926_23690 [bacterium]|nr:hypothetical protein [bacterium]
MRPDTEMYHHVSLQLQTMLESGMTSKTPPPAACVAAPAHIGAITAMRVLHTGF